MEVGISIYPRFQDVTTGLHCRPGDVLVPRSAIKTPPLKRSASVAGRDRAPIPDRSGLWPATGEDADA
jgi:hypothetical protein